MPKKKKHPRLPNGFGQISKLSGNRRNPYAVYPPSDTFDSSGRYIRKKALCYVPEWMIGFAVLAKYRAGTYQAGDEIDITEEYYKDQETPGNKSFVSRILADHSAAMAMIRGRAPAKTFSDIYKEFYYWKYERPGCKEFAKSTKYKSQSSFSHFAALHDKDFCSITAAEIQKCVDTAPLKACSKEPMLVLAHELYEYADLIGLTKDDPSRHVKIMQPDDCNHGVPFTIREVVRFYDDRDNPIAALLYMLCYSGWRIMEYAGADVDLEARTMTGGSKTRAGKGRTVPIHSAIYDMIKAKIEQDGRLMEPSHRAYVWTARRMPKYLESAGMDPTHTFHDCRHTFSMLCEKFDVRENDRKRMLGHALKDITNKVYGHRTVEDLREQIEKIPAPDVLRSCCD